jgi:hypothetical protein
VRTIVDLLVRGEYETVERITRGERLTATDMAEAVAGYGRTLTTPGLEWWSLVVVTPIRPPGRRLHVAAPLWTREEGRSDLTLELELTEFAPEAYETAVENIHVL